MEFNLIIYLGPRLANKIIQFESKKSFLDNVSLLAMNFVHSLRDQEKKKEINY